MELDVCEPPLLQRLDGSYLTLLLGSFLSRGTIDIGKNISEGTEGRASKQRQPRKQALHNCRFAPKQIRYQNSNIHCDMKLYYYSTFLHRIGDGDDGNNVHHRELLRDLPKVPRACHSEPRGTRYHTDYYATPTTNTSERAHQPQRCKWVELRTCFHLRAKRFPMTERLAICPASPNAQPLPHLSD